uniref:BPTI/Kunitz inhibitor domain-containing protein n=1 Tax=Amblyomma cajennense TaxID=34607 RepID=A0A023FC57_AMBCJ
MNCFTPLLVLLTATAPSHSNSTKKNRCQPKEGSNRNPVGWSCTRENSGLACYPRNYFYNSSSNRCEEFDHKGCRGNQNNFPSGEDCSDHCQRSSVPTYPVDESKHGKVLASWLRKLPPCNVTFDPAEDVGGITRFFYNSTSNRCEVIHAKNGDKYFPAMRYCVDKCSEGQAQLHRCTLGKQLGRFPRGWTCERTESRYRICRKTTLPSSVKRTLK